MSWVTCPASPVLGHPSWVTCPGSPFLGHLSCVICRGSPVLGHLSCVACLGSPVLCNLFWVKRSWVTSKKEFHYATHVWGICDKTCCGSMDDIFTWELANASMIRMLRSCAAQNCASHDTKSQGNYECARSHGAGNVISTKSNPCLAFGSEDSDCARLRDTSVPMLVHSVRAFFATLMSMTSSSGPAGLLPSARHLEDVIGDVCSSHFALMLLDVCCKRRVASVISCRIALARCSFSSRCTVSTFSAYSSVFP